MRMHGFGKFNRTLGLCLATLSLSILVSVSAFAQTNTQRCKAFLNDGKFPEAVEAGSAAAKADPHNAEAWSLLGCALYETGAFDKAEHALTKVIPLTDPDKDHQILAETNDRLGNIYLVNHGELGLAEDCFQKEMEHAREARDPHLEALAHYNCGLVLRKRDAHKDALKEFNEALKLELRDTQRIVYQSALAEELLLTGDTTAAMSVIQVVERTAINIPDVKVKARARFACGQLYMQAGEAERDTHLAANMNQAIKDFHTANDQLKDGFQALHQANVHDLYSEALGYKLFGNLVETQGNRKAALERYQQALTSAKQIGRHVELIYELNARIGDLNPSLDKEAVLGAIDIGSKGVKGILVSIVSAKNGKTSITVIYQRSINTDLVANKFNAQSIQATATAVHDEIDEMAHARKGDNRVAFKISRIYVACSSALTEGENQAANQAALANQIFLATKAESMAPANRPNATPETAMLYVNSVDELWYGMMGSIDPEDRKTSSLLDLGSGNGRWGYISADSSGRTPVFVDIPRGSSTLWQAAVQNKLAGEEYTVALEREANKQVGAVLRKKVQETPALMTRKKVYIIGGAAYALVTLLHPEAAKQDEVELTHADLRRFYDLILGVYPYRPDLANIPDNNTRQLAEQQIDDVYAHVFKTRELLLSAAILLKTLDIDALQPDQKLVFPRHGSWALGLAEYKYFTEVEVEDKTQSK